MAMQILTDRLELVAADAHLARALAEDVAEVSRVLGAHIPQEWPPELMDASALAFVAQATARASDALGWWVWLVVLPTDRVLIGCVGFKGPPDSEGRVDIGYSVLDAWQRRGYASEAVGALVDWALADPRVVRIIGETFPHLTPSIRVLEKSGFSYLGVGVGHEGEPEVLQFERRRA
jgi:[ribosomal protein S5]-alanine N-acetyltransferase